MHSLSIMAIVLLLGVLSTTATRGESNNTRHMEGGVTIILTDLNITDKSLELCYQIRNDSLHDVWLCDAVDGLSHIEHYIDEDGQTLKVRRRLDVPMRGIDREPPFGRYVRLGKEESRSESLLLQLPVESGMPVFTAPKIYPGDVIAQRLSLEIGFYNGDLPEMAVDLLSKDTRESERVGGLVSFIRWNEHLRNRDERIEIPWLNQTLKGEEILEITLANLRIPCAGRPRWTLSVPPPDLTRCTSAKVRYHPSMLEYFFPYGAQQALLNPTEKEYLQSQKETIVQDATRLRDFALDVARGAPREILRGGGTACVVCYSGDKRSTSFTVYSNIAIETEDKHRFAYLGGGGLETLRKLTPQIQPFELRARCADNLKGLSYRFRLYHRVTNAASSESSQTKKAAYPKAERWCDATKFAYSNLDLRPSLSSGDSFELYKCASAGEGECHYAMNPACKPDSPSDMVLLFETKAGWNQHGGPELFTFDNHDPQGGLVLLNDGTVKFIRTEEELKQLRWK